MSKKAKKVPEFVNVGVRFTSDEWSKIKTAMNVYNERQLPGMSLGELSDAATVRMLALYGAAQVK